MHTPKFQLAMEGHLEQALRVDRRIGLEAGILSNFANTLREGIPSMLSSVTSALRSAEIPEDTSKKGVQFHRPEFLRLLEKHNYVHLSALSVFVPEGFKGNLAMYAIALLESAEHANKVVADSINPYNTFLSTLLSSSNARLSSFAELSYLAKKDLARDNLNKEIGKFFNAGSTASKQPMGSVISRNADWQALLLTLPRIQKASEEVSRQTVQKSVDECLELIGAVKEGAKAGELDNLSGPMIKQLSQATLSVAREVEFYSVTAFRIGTLNTVVDQSINSVTNALK